MRTQGLRYWPPGATHSGRNRVLTPSRPDLLPAPLFWAPSSPMWPSEAGPAVWALFFVAKVPAEMLCSLWGPRRQQAQPLTCPAPWGLRDINSQEPGLLCSLSQCCPTGSGWHRHREQGQGCRFSQTGSTRPGDADVPGHTTGTHLPCAHTPSISHRAVPQGRWGRKGALRPSSSKGHLLPRLG